MMPANGSRYAPSGVLVGGTRERHFAGTNLKPRKRGASLNSGGMTLAFIAPSAMEHLSAVRWHIPEAAHHHAHGFVLRKENRLVSP